MGSSRRKRARIEAAEVRRKGSCRAVALAARPDIMLKRVKSVEKGLFFAM